MDQKNNYPKFTLGKIKSRRGVAEIISTLLLVVITVVGAIILTSFIDESFVSGSLSVSSGTDITIKKIKLWGYDTRNGDELMDPLYSLNNTNTVVSDKLCRSSCSPNTTPDQGGSNFMILQIENKNVKSLFLKNIMIEDVSYPYDPETFSKTLDFTASDSSGGLYPSDGRFSILSSDAIDQVQKNNEIKGGETVNLLIKLDTSNDDLELSKTMRIRLNIGENSLAQILVETGDAR